jgi:hypothetical protein
MRPITELFFTVIYRGSFGWMFGERGANNSIIGLQKGWGFNLPYKINQNISNPWWSTTNTRSYTNFPVVSFNTSPLPNQPRNSFNSIRPFVEGNILDGDFCEWNNYEQKERVISNCYHKMKYNSGAFDIGPSGGTKTNKNGYYYTPHYPITLRVFSDYIETGDPKNVAGVPDYSYYSTTLKQFIWRDIYDYGFIDADGLGVDYPFLNGAHYPFVNNIFRIIPEGSSYSEQSIIFTPTIDPCE